MTNLENRVVLNNTIGYKVSKIESLDIDTQEDLDYARFVSKSYLNNFLYWFLFLYIFQITRGTRFFHLLSVSFNFKLKSRK